MPGFTQKRFRELAGGTVVGSEPQRKQSRVGSSRTGVWGGPLSLVRTRTCDPPRDQSTRTVGQQEGECEAAGGTPLGPHLPLAEVSPGLLL